MSCVFTGCKIYFRNYGYVARGDAYLLNNNTLIFRWNPESREWVDEVASNANFCIQVLAHESDWWHREDLGVTVVPEIYVRNLSGYR